MRIAQAAQPARVAEKPLISGPEILRGSLGSCCRTGTFRHQPLGRRPAEACLPWEPLAAAAATHLQRRDEGAVRRGLTRGGRCQSNEDSLRGCKHCKPPRRRSLCWVTRRRTSREGLDFTPLKSSWQPLDGRETKLGTWEGAATPARVPPGVPSVHRLLAVSSWPAILLRPGVRQPHASRPSRLR